MIVSVLVLRHAAVMQQSCGPRAGWWATARVVITSPQCTHTGYTRPSAYTPTTNYQSDRQSVTDKLDTFMPFWTRIGHSTEHLPESKIHWQIKMYNEAFSPFLALFTNLPRLQKYPKFLYYYLYICLYSQAWAWPGQTAWHHGQADQYHSPTLMFGAITIIIVCASLYIYLMCLLQHFLYKTVTHSTDCFLDPTELLCIQSRFRGSGRQEVQY